MKIAEIHEGDVKLSLPITKKVPTKEDAVFYNSVMEMNRDLSVLALQTFLKMKKLEKKAVGIDLLAASGVRGLRYAKECKVKKVLLNDLNPTAVETIENNAELNKLEDKIEVYKEDANVLLYSFKEKFDFIDIDPFGSPIYYINAAAFALKKNSFLGVTATDTAPLAGTYPKTCLKRYNALPLREDIQHEVGIRILIAGITKIFAEHKKTFHPVFCFAKEHYYRIHGIAGGKEKMKIGYVLYCKKCGNRKLVKVKNIKKCNYCHDNFLTAGPLWIGSINNYEFIKNFESAKHNKFIEILKEETKIDNLFYDIHTVCKKNRLEILKTQDLIDKLKKKGFKASKTNFMSTAVRTNASIKELIKFFIKC